MRKNLQEQVSGAFRLRLLLMAIATSIAMLFFHITELAEVNPVLFVIAMSVGYMWRDVLRLGYQVDLLIAVVQPHDHADHEHHDPRLSPPDERITK